MFNLAENIDISYDWLSKEIFKQKIKQQQTNRTVTVKVEYIKLLELFQKFVELNIKTN